MTHLKIGQDHHIFIFHTFAKTFEIHITMKRNKIIEARRAKVSPEIKEHIDRLFIMVDQLHKNIEVEKQNKGIITLSLVTKDLK